MKIEICQRTYYRVKRGQTVRELAETLHIPPSVLYGIAGGEVSEGQALRLPEERRNLYTVQGGESKTLLCGSRENFEERNRTAAFYPGQLVWL